MKLLTIFVLLVFTISLSANESYLQILITKTSKQSSLKSIKSKLDRLDIKMYIQKSRTGFFVYSPRYGDSKSAQSVLRKIKRYFPSAYIIQSKKVAIKQKEEKNFINNTKTTNSASTQNSDKSNYFVNIAFGSASVGISNDSSVEIENSATSVTLEGGYIYDDDIFFTLGYLSSSTSDADINNIYLSSNFLFKPMQDIGIYTGVLVGYGTLTLNIYGNNVASKVFTLGAQLGAKYNIYEDIDIYLAYQGLMLDHVIKIIEKDGVSTSGVEYGMLHNIQFGVSYRF